jgi:hypothetical protein
MLNIEGVAVSLFVHRLLHFLSATRAMSVHRLLHFLSVTRAMVVATISTALGDGWKTSANPSQG